MCELWKKQIFDIQNYFFIIFILVRFIYVFG